MSKRKTSRKMTVVWVLVGIVAGALLPGMCSRVEDYVGWLIGSNCWRALIQLEAFKEQSNLLRPAMGGGKV